MTTLAEWNSVPGVKDLNPLMGPYGIDPNSTKAVEQLIVSLMREAVTVENSLNTTRADRVNFFGTSINEKSEFSGSIKVPVTLGTVSVA